MKIRNIINEIKHYGWLLLFILHDYYWNKFSYNDNRLCLYLEKYFGGRVIRCLAFHAYHITMFLCMWVLSLWWSKFMEIPTPISITLGFVFVIACVIYKSKQRSTHNELQHIR